MEAFGVTDLRKLLGESGAPRVSLYQPTTPGGGREDPIVWKNLLSQANEQLLAAGVRSSEARGLLAPAARLLEDQSFWKQTRAGLACFLAPGTFRIVKLAKPVGPQALVSNLFAIKPLLPHLAKTGAFYVLALSQKSVKLWRGTETELGEVEVAALPKGLADALRFHDRDEPLMFHSLRSGADWGGIFHGQGVGIDTVKDDLLLYFRQVDRALHDYLRDSRAPLVLASVEYLWPIYGSANTYPHLSREGIPGNPEHVPPRELHARAWKIVGRAAEDAEREAIALFDRLHATGRTSTRAEDVLGAACQGKLEFLFVAADAMRWGLFDHAQQRIELHEQRASGDEDLLNVAAIHTFLNGGTVFVVPASMVPGGTTQAGIAWLPLDKHAK